MGDHGIEAPPADKAHYIADMLAQLSTMAAEIGYTELSRALGALSARARWKETFSE